MGRLQSETGTSILLITTISGLFAEVARDIAVMYAGQIANTVQPEPSLRPLHPYTVGLLESIPHRWAGSREAMLKVIPGTVPPLYHLPPGCRFQDRCPDVFTICRTEEPLLKKTPPSCVRAGIWELRWNKSCSPLKD